MISICIITKNESKNIRECLERISPFQYEIIVVDTGSSDDTKNIAFEFTDKVYDFKWENDFSSARNFCISKATQEFILVIDCDEYLTEFDKNEFEKLIKKNSNSVGRICRTNLQSNGNEQVKIMERINRLFPKELFHYSGRIHEQVTENDNSDYNTYDLPIFFDHVGYDGDIEFRNKKAKRNIELLDLELQQNQNDTYLLYQLGKSYYMQQDYSSACDYFSRALSFDLDTRLEYVIDMVETYGYALLNSKRYAEALPFENIYEAFGHRAEFNYLMGLIYMNNAIFDQAIEKFLKATKYRQCQIEGVNSFMAFYNVGVIYECLGDIENALAYYRKSGGYDKAKARIEIIIKG